ncbi:hypothetical protein SAMD00019534_068770, partial [Acytostelium subglobosum LB1]|uniref:hypothetical protein n=1 Tax=Acytostelium subglobosum LB1 TaxID=1410327 RepID=UPI000644B242
MQAGFSLLEAGMVRAKNTKNILVKIWNESGWLYKLGVVDYGGGIVVHVLGGTIGLVGTIILGPRLGKFDPETGKPLVLSEHNIVLSSIGTLLLWFSWYGQHPILLGVDINKGRIASRGEVSTTLSGSISMVTSFVITLAMTKRYDLKICINGLLAGFVAASSASGFIAPYYSIIIGVVASFIFIGFSKLLLRYQIDDPCQSTSVHFACGIWGAICVGLFALLFIQLIGVSATIIWCTVLSYIVFKILKKYSVLRVDSDIELTGFDNAHHGGAAYNYR